MLEGGREEGMQMDKKRREAWRRRRPLLCLAVCVCVPLFLRVPFGMYLLRLLLPEVALLAGLRYMVYTYACCWQRHEIKRTYDLQGSV